MKFSNLILILFFSFQLSAQLDINWSNVVGGSSSDRATGILETDNYKFLVFGSSLSDDLDLSTNRGLSDIVLIQTNEIGGVEWIRNYGGTAADTADDIIESQEGGYLMVGHSRSSDGQVQSNQGVSDVWIVKLDDFGEIDWRLTVGDTLVDDLGTVVQDVEGNYMILSRSQKEDTFDDFLLTKVDQEGTIIWDRNYGGSQTEFPSSILETNDGFIITGSSLSNDLDVSGNNGELDYWVLMIDKEGNKVWDRNYGGLGTEVLNASVSTQDGNFVVVGRAVSLDPTINSGDLWILKLDMNGEILWERIYGGADIDNPTQIKEADNGDLIIAGYTSSSDGDLTSNNGNNDFWVLQLDEDGNLRNSVSFGGSLSDRLQGLTLSDGRILVTGSTFSNDFDIGSNNGSSDIWFGELGLTTSVGELEQEDNVVIYPNPAHNTLSVDFTLEEKLKSFSLMTMDGKLVKSSASSTLNIAQLASGTYIATVVSNRGTYQEKVVVVGEK